MHMYFLQLQILVSLLPFQNLRTYLKFQKVDEGVHRETKLPWIFNVKKPSLFKIPRLADNSNDVSGARRVPLH